MHNDSSTEGVTLGRVGGHQIHIAPAHIAASYQHAHQIAAELGTKDPESSLAAYWSLTGRAAQWQHVLDQVGHDRASTLQFVEVGSGLGLFTLMGAALGLRIVGVESSSDRYLASMRVARAVFVENGFTPTLIQSRSELLPLPDACADVVMSFQTLEHVADLKQTLSEMRRVLRPGGWFLAQVPNYASFYEGHYGTLAPLGLGKAWTRRYLQLLRRPTHFLDHLQWLSPAYLRKTLCEIGFSSITIHRTISRVLKDDGIATAYPTPFRFRRGTLANRAAYGVALCCDKLGISADLYPQIQVWAHA
jgi:ubiquinone/menaquinone biosynthesis C-methylase UbiE